MSSIRLGRRAGIGIGIAFCIVGAIAATAVAATSGSSANTLTVVAASPGLAPVAVPADLTKSTSGLALVDAPQSAIPAGAPGLASVISKYQVQLGYGTASQISSASLAYATDADHLTSPTGTDEMPAINHRLVWVLVARNVPQTFLGGPQHGTVAPSTEVLLADAATGTFLEATYHTN